MSKRLSSAPVSPHFTWNDLLRDYDTHHRPNREAELSWFANQDTFERAIQLAARAENHRGKRLDHQRRIRREAIPVAQSSLTANIAILRAAPSFQALLKAVDVSVGLISGVGELYCYDAALRLGAFLRLAPEYVYLHAGARKGARALLRTLPDSRRLSREQLPVPLRSRSAAEIENILCVYERTFATGNFSPSKCGSKRN